LRLVHAVGRRMPALPTALGVTLLARQADEQILNTLDGKLDGAEARENALARIKETRRTGVFNLFDGMRSGVSAVGAAVCDPARHENISFSISYPSDAVDEPLLKRMRVRVREEALRIGKSVGDPFWSDPSRGEEVL
jgi:DNA-binding IclR family transcriptional regulator